METNYNSSTCRSLTTWWQRFAFALMLATMAGAASAQCINGANFGTATVGPVGSFSSPNPITTCAFYSEYSTVNGLVATETYQVTNVPGTNYITITDASNVVLASGFSPLNITGIAGTIRIHPSLSASDCAGGSGCVTQSIQTLAPPGPPLCQTAYSPVNLASNQALATTLSWTPGGSNPANTGYDVYFGSTFPPPLVSANQAATSFFPGVLLCNTVYYWRVNPKNAFGGGSTTTCAVQAFQTIGLSGCPASVTPADASVNIPVSQTLSWGSVANATGYNVYMDAGVNPPTTLIVNNALVTTYIPPSPLLCNTTYYWRVEPITCAGPQPACAVTSFTTVATIPTCPASFTPANLATGVAQAQVLSWGASTGATGYNLYLDPGPGPATTLVSANQAATTYTPTSPLLCNQQYAWRVEPLNCNGPNTTCANLTFTTISTAPTLCPTLTPGAAATGIVLGPTLTWTAVTGASAYDVYFGTGTPPPLVASNVTVLYYTPGLLPANTLHYWRVEPKNCVGSNTTCIPAGSTFTTGTTGGLINYDVTMTSGITYNSIAGTGTSLGWVGLSTDDNTSNTVTLPGGFDFVYNGVTVTGFKACTNGWMTFNTAQTTTVFSNNIGTQTTLNTALCPLWDDWVTQGNPTTLAGLQAAMKYEIQGTAPNRVLVMEWISMERFGVPGPNLNWQVRCYETSDNIEFVYGTMESFDGGNNFGHTYSLGLNAAVITTGSGGPSAGQVLAQQFGREKNFGAQLTNSTVANGPNNLTWLPDCNTSILFTPGTYSGNGPAIGAPSNDNPGTAIALPTNPLPCTSFCGTYYTSRLATPSPGLPTCTGIPDDDVFFTFVPTNPVPPGVTGTRVTVRSYNNYNAAIQVLDNTLANVACIDVIGAGLTEILNLTTLIPGNTYYIRVFHNAAGSGTTLSPGTVAAGEFEICVSDLVPPPVNDDCGGAILLTSNQTCVPTASPNMLTSTASVQASCNGTPDDDVWYSFIPSIPTPTITVQSGVGFNAVLQIFNGAGGCGSLTSLYCQNATAAGGIETVNASGLIIGNTYYARVYHQAVGSSGGGFTICVVEAPPSCSTLLTPANNANTTTPNLTWTAALGATGYDVYLEAGVNPPTTIVSTNQAGTSYAPGVLTNNVTYYWAIAPRNAIGVNTTCAPFNFTTCAPPVATGSLVANCGAGVDTLKVTLTSIGSAPSVDIVATPGGLFTGGDDYAGPVPANFTLVVPAGGTYSVNVINNAIGACQLSVGSFTDCCSGICAGAVTVTPGVILCPTINCGAGAASGGNTSGGATLHARWFKFTPPNNGTMQVIACDSSDPLEPGPNNPPGPPYNSDTRGRIRTGTCGAQTQLAAFDDECTTPTFGSYSPVLNVTAGTDYYIEWDNFWSGNSFNWQLDYLPCDGGVTNVTVNQTCGVGGSYTLDLNKLTMGSATGWIVKRNTVSIDTIYSAGLYNYGPFPLGISSTMTLTDLNVAACVINLGDFADCCGGTCATANAAVVGTNFTGPMNCGAGASNAAVDPGLPPTPTDARWFYYSTPSQGFVTVSSCDPPNGAPNPTNPDTYVTIHQGSICGSTSVIGFDDDACFTPGFGSNASFVATAGTNYFIEWDDRWNSAGHAWSLAFTPCPVSPVNDLCTNQVPASTTISSASLPVSFSGDVNCSDRDAIGPLFISSVAGWVWHSFKLTDCARVTVDYCASASYNNQSIGSVFLVNSCAATALIQPNAFNFTSCTAGIEQAFFDLGPGDYYLPVLWSPSLNLQGAYTVTIDANAPTAGCSTCATASTVTCGTANAGTTTGFVNTLPANGCFLPAGQPANSGGSVWYKYTHTGTNDTLVTVTTCSPSASYNTRVSVFTTPDCVNYCCVAYNDNGPNPPCTASGSRTRFIASPGVDYYIVVHGSAASGTFTLNVICEPACVPPANDKCSTAQAITPVVMDGTGTFITGDNTCAMPDPNLVTCNPAGSVQGVWYSLNSGPHQSLRITLDDALPYTSADQNWTLFTGCNTGGCAIGGSTQVACDATVSPYSDVTVNANTNYLLHVWNAGGVGVHGTFGLLVEYPANFDAAIDSVVVPYATVCGTTFTPQVVLENRGQVQINSATITFQIDAGTPVVYNWFGALDYLETEIVSMSLQSVTPGIHTFTVEVTNPNGQIDEIPANDDHTEVFDASGQPVRIFLRTDNFGSETSYEIYDAFDFSLDARGGTATPIGGGSAGPWPSNSDITDDLCLPQNGDGNYCYLMFVFDSFGDGMCCGFGQGFWSVQTQQGGVMLRDKFELASTISPISSPFIGHPFCLPVGNVDILGTECNIFTNTLLNKVYCENVGAPSYQFEFTDPDNGLFRRIAVPRNWVKFSEMQVPALEAGRVYFSHVRIDQGAPGFFDDRFGTGCDMAIDPSTINGCTQLIDEISLPTHSCGVTRATGASQKIWAVPVPAAVQYRFNFSNGLIDPDGSAGPLPAVLGQRNYISNNYVCPLGNWATYSLVDGQTYDVKVEVFLNGQWRGYCGATCTLTIDNTPMQGGPQQSMAPWTEQQNVTLWPNPVRDGLVNLVLDQLGTEEQSITIDIFDAAGKRVFAKEYANEGDLFTTQLGVDGLSAGSYQVNITVNGETITERLTVQ